MSWVLRAWVLAGVWSACAGTALAQSSEKWPAWPGNFSRGNGFYLSWYKLPLFWLMFVLWVRTADWINQDGQRLGLEYRRWNQVVFFSFVAAAVLLWILPFEAAFWIGFPLMIAAYMGSLVSYVVHRNSRVLPHQKVFTRAHLRFWLSERLGQLGIRIAAEAPDKDPYPIKLTAVGGATPRDDNVHLLTARQLPAFDLTRGLLAAAFAQRSDVILMDYTQQAVSVRYQIDSVWHNAEGQDRQTGDAILAVLKTLTGMNVAERRARQQGKFAAEYNKTNQFTCRLTCQGTKAGERVLIQVEDPAVKTVRLPALGMRDKVQEQLKELLEQKAGLVLVSAPPGGGLSSLFSASVAAMDRYMRSVAAIEEAAARELEVENVQVTTYEAAAGQSPATVLPKLIREYPEVYAVADLVDVESARILLEQASDDRMVVVGVRSREASEALLRVLALGVPAGQLATAATAVVNQRLVRKLCETCREPYPPPAEVLKKLGLPADRVEAFYRPPQPPADAKQVCPDCQGIGYYGRTGIFELLVVDDQVRATLTSQPQLDRVRLAARKAGMRTLQEEGLLLVVKGVTSLPELMRALKE